MFSLFQHFTFGFQQLSKLFHDFTTDSYQIQTYAKNSTTVFQATARPISAFPLVCNRCFQQLTVTVHRFFPFPGLVFISFFFRSLSHQLSSLCYCFFTFYVHPFHFFHHLFSFWHCLYMAFIVIYCFINFNHL